MVRRYITAEEFNDFSDNQNKLISILNHTMTELVVDVGWIKKIMWWQMGIFATIGTGIILTLFLVGAN